MMAAPGTLRRPITALVIVLLLPATSPGPRAANPPDATRPPGPPVETVATELILIEAYVTDDAGRPIENLTAEDFTLQVDGRPSPIASLDIHRIAAPEGSTPPGAEPATSGGAIRAAEYPRRFMLFFEDGMSGPGGLTAARHAVDRFLSSGLQPSDEVALASYDTGLRVLHDFTGDREALRRSIAGTLSGSRRISTAYAEHGARLDELAQKVRQWEQEVLTAKMDAMKDPRAKIEGHQLPMGRSGDPSQGVSRLSPPFSGPLAPLKREFQVIEDLAIDYGSERTVLLRRVLSAVGVLVDGLSAWPGHKALIFMGDGVSEQPAMPYASIVTEHHPDPDLIQRASTYSLAPEVDAVRRSAAAKGVTIHILQTRGLSAGTDAELKAEREESDTIAALALATGGLRSSSNDFVKALQTFEESSRTYYVLGYSPSGPPDGGYHAVQVHCRRPGAHVRSREGFTRWTPDEARRRAILSAHMLPELFQDAHADLSAAFGPRDGSRHVVDFVLNLPAAAVTFAPGEDGSVARLEVGIVVQDEHGTETYRSDRAIRFHRPGSGPGDPSVVNLFWRLSLPDKEQVATAVVLDDASGTIGAVRVPLPATPREADGVLGLALYAVEDQGLWIEVPLDQVLASEHEASHGGLVGPSVRTTFAVGESPVCAFRRPVAGQDGNAALQVEIRQDGKHVRTVAVPPTEAGPAATVQVALPTAGLSPGDFTVTIQAVHQEGPLDRGTVPLRLRAAAPPASGA